MDCKFTSINQPSISFKNGLQIDSNQSIKWKFQMQFKVILTDVKQS